RAIQPITGPALIRYITGGTIDRAVPEVTWLAVVDAEAAPPDRGLAWCRPDALVAAPALMPGQQAAIRRYRDGRANGPRGPFEDPQWPERVRRWVAETLRSDISAVRFAKQYRAAPDEAVAALDTVAGRVFFKATSAAPFSEAALTMALARDAPSRVAPTLAFDAANGWWLAHGLPGREPHDRAEHLAVVEALVD